MKIVDANVLIYAVSRQSPRHTLANAWLTQVMRESETIGFSWLVLIAFLRITTHRGLSPQPLPIQQATQIVQTWLEQPCATLLSPTERHLTLINELLDPIGIAGDLTNDAHLAALAIEHGATVYSFDNDFSRFPRVRWAVPSI